MAWAVVYFGKMLNHLGRYSRGWAIFCAFCAWLVGAIDSLVGAAVAQVTSLFASFSTTGMGSVDFAGLEYIGHVNAIIPLDHFAVILGIYVTAWITVIIIRWIKSFVPTIAN